MGQPSIRRTMPKNAPSTPVNSDDEACQLDMFGAGKGGTLDDRWSTVMLAIRQAVNELEPQNVAYDLETTASGLAHALAERDRHFPAKWLLYLIEKSTKGPAIAGYLAAIAGWNRRQAAMNAHIQASPGWTTTRRTWSRPATISGATSGAMKMIDRPLTG